MAELAEDVGQPAKTVQPLNSAIDAPLFYADSAMLCTTFNDTIRVSFVQSAADPLEDRNPGWKTRYVGTLVMPTAAFLVSLDYINRQIEKMRTDGVLPGT